LGEKLGLLFTVPKIKTSWKDFFLGGKMVEFSFLDHRKLLLEGRMKAGSPVRRPVQGGSITWMSECHICIRSSNDTLKKYIN
jgi:hypothetical protein